METAAGTSSGTGGVTLTEASRLLGINRDALKKRVQRGAIPAYKDETGAWLVVIPERDTAGEASRDMGDGTSGGQLSPAAPSQLAEVMDQWLAPLVRQIAEQGEEIGGLKADLRHERERRETIEQDYEVAKKELSALRFLARTDKRKQQEALERAVVKAEAEMPVQSANVAPGGAGEAERVSEKPQRWPWWMRLLGGK